MKMTMLEMVQNIMSDLDSDELDSISDTTEGEQVASTIRDVYWQLVSNQVIPEHKSLAQLTSAGTPAYVFMEIPDTIGEIDWLKYNKIEDGDDDNNFSDVKYLAPEAFINMLLQRKSSDSNVMSVTDPTSSISLDMIINDQPPTYWTSFDDQYITFDSFDEDVDPVGLVGSKTLLWATVIPEFDTDDMVDDDFTPDLDDNLFPMLLAEAKSTCFVNMKQTSNPKVEKQSRDQKVFKQNDKHRTAKAEKESTGTTGPNYGRRRR